MSALIEVRDLYKVYGSGDNLTPALEAINLDIARGEFLAIMGPSGSGKSTLMNILGCLDVPTTGSYHLDGEDVAEMSDDQLAEVRAAKIGFVFQSFNLLSRATVMRNVQLPFLYSRIPVSERDERADAALKAVSLDEDRWDHMSNELSGGQMQRVAIARALVNDPPLILADEPTGNLDSKTGHKILMTFRELQRQGRTVVLITHDAEVAEIADRVVHIRDGRLVDQATADAHDAAEGDDE